MKPYLTVVLTIIVILSGVSITNAQTPDNCVNTVMVWDNDTITSIARENGFVPQELAQLNGLNVSSPLKIGDVLCTDGLAPAQPPSQDDDQPPLQGGGNESTAPQGDTAAEPISADGDSLLEAAERYGTGGDGAGQQQVNGETGVNGFLGGSNFRRGQGSVPDAWRNYTVAAGDRLNRIAKAFAVPQEQIEDANNIANPDVIFVGETLLIPPSTEEIDEDEPPLIGGGTETPDEGSVPETEVHVPPRDSIPDITLSPRIANPGDTITVSGLNYPGLTDVELFLEKKSLGVKSNVLETVTTNADGTFSTELTIPTTWPSGGAVTFPTVSISGYATQGGWWAMDYFINAAD